MPSNHDLFHCAERLSEEGRLLWILGRSLARATNDPSNLGSWAIRTYRELQALELQPAPVTNAPQRPARLPAKVDAGTPVLAWVASSSRQQEWTSVAVGVDINGNKQILAVVEGSTSDPMVCRHLLEALAGDSLLLLITDGSLTLDDTIRLRWDNPPKIAHCRTDTRKSVLAHLQGEKRRRVDEKLQAAWSQAWPQSEESLKAILCDLRGSHPGAADRLERSLEATLVVDKLEVQAPLREHLLVAGVPRTAYDVAVRRGGEAGTLKDGLAAWLQQTRRLPGYRALANLVEHIDATKLQEKEQAASQSLTSKDAAHTSNG